MVIALRYTIFLQFVYDPPPPKCSLLLLISRYTEADSGKLCSPGCSLSIAQSPWTTRLNFYYNILRCGIK